MDFKKLEQNNGQVELYRNVKKKSPPSSQPRITYAKFKLFYCSRIENTFPPKIDHFFCFGLFCKRFFFAINSEFGVHLRH